MVSMNKYVIMIVEDNQEIREGIRLLFSGEAYEILEAASGESCLDMYTDRVDLIILDIMMPGISGLKTCEEIRKRSNAPILFLTAKARESDKLIGLMAGGDDYLTKPFSYTELLARTKALLRRYYFYKGKEDDGHKDAKQEDYLVRGKIKINTKYNEVLMGSKKVELPEIEYNMLLLMMKHPGRIFSTKNLYESVWQEPYFYVSNNTVMVHIRKLRIKIEKDSKNPEYIHTIWGKGYKFDTTY